MARGIHGGDGSPAAPPYSADIQYEVDTPFIFQKPNVESSERFVLTENFDQPPLTNGSLGVDSNLDFEVLGSGASDDDVTFGAEIAGILLTADSGSTNAVIVLPHLSTKQTAWTGVLWGTENEVIWEVVIRTGANIASIIIWAGLKLTNTSTVATDDDAVYFRFDTVVANWEATTSIGDADVETDTGVALVINTIYYLKIEIDSDRKAHFFIDNVEVYVSTALTDAIDLIPYIGVQGASKTLYIVKQKISRVI